MVRRCAWGFDCLGLARRDEKVNRCRAADEGGRAASIAPSPVQSCAIAGRSSGGAWRGEGGQRDLERNPTIAGFSQVSEPLPLRSSGRCTTSTPPPAPAPAPESTSRPCRWPSSTPQACKPTAACSSPAWTPLHGSTSDYPWPAEKTCRSLTPPVPPRQGRYATERVRRLALVAADRGCRDENGAQAAG